MRGRSAVVALLLGCYPIAALSQAASGPGSAGAKGWFLGLALNGSALTLEEPLDDETETGGGLLLHGGYGFTSNLALFLEGTAAAMDSEGESWILSHGDIGLRYHFASPGRSFVPFVEGALTGWLAAREDVQLLDGQRDELEITGTGFTLGGGFLYFFTSRMALLTALKWTRGEFNEVKFGNVSVEGLDLDATSARLNLGLTFFLGGGR